MNLKEFLFNLLEGRDNPGVPDGTGPYKKSKMAQINGTGPKKGMQKGNCPKRENYETEEEYKKALKAWQKKQKK